MAHAHYFPITFPKPLLQVRIIAVFLRNVEQVLAYQKAASDSDLGQQGYLILTPQARIKLQFVSADIVRIRVHFEQKPLDYQHLSRDELWTKDMPERSYALVTTAWPDELDELLQAERQRIAGYAAQLEFENGKQACFSTQTMKLVLHKKPIAFSLVDKASGQEIYADLRERAFDRDHLGRLTHYNRIDPVNDHFFGFGESTGYLDKKGRHLHLCPRDAIGHDPETCESMYKHIPFYVRVNELQGHYVGLFYNNSHDAIFDMGNERSGYWEPYSFYQVDGGDIDFFLINGPQLKDVIRRFTKLTGTTAMPTLQSLGFTMSTMYYAELEKDCDREILHVINSLEQNDIPIDNFWLASGYSSGEKDNLRYTFNWNHKRFPQPQDFFAACNKLGINVIPNLKPGVLMGHPYKQYYIEHDALVKIPHAQPLLAANAASATAATATTAASSATGAAVTTPSAMASATASATTVAASSTTSAAANTGGANMAAGAAVSAGAATGTTSGCADQYYVGRWWGGPGYFVDFTNPQGRAAWSHLLQENILKMGTKTVWNDNCEFDGVEDREAVVAAEGKGGTMTEYKAIQANMMAYTAKDAIAAVYPHERPYIINRAGYTGIQRYAQVWGGDNLTSWRTLKFNVSTILGMGLSGVANTGCDIGGFAGGAPDAELLVRWIQNGVFQPRFTMNSANNDNSVTQPFMYPEYLQEIKDAYALRYHYMVYLYSLMRVAHLEGLPVWRPLFMEFPEDVHCLNDQSLSFMFGPSLLVATVLEQGQSVRDLYLPAGHTWYDLNDHFKAYAGGQVLHYPVTMSTIPMFLRDNAIVIASDELKRLVFSKVKTLQLTIAATGNDPHDNLSFDYYEDDGHSLDFTHDNYANTKITVIPSHQGKRLEINFAKTGSYQHSYQDLYVQVVSKYKGALFVACEQEALPRFLAPDEFAQASSGWYYNMSSRVIEIKLPKPAKENFSLMVSTEHFDLIGMENNG